MSGLIADLYPRTRCFHQSFLLTGDFATLSGMSLPSRTIQKLMRETFRGTPPLVFDRTERDGLASRIRESLGGIEGVDATTSGYVREEEKPRYVCEFSINDPNAYYYYRSRESFRLLLDDAGRLTIQEANFHTLKAVGAMISDLDEIVVFVRRYKQRIDRQRAIKAKREKIREIQTQAIVAQVRKLAREDRFDFAYEADPRKLNLYVKLSEKNILVLYVPFKDFKECLPRLGSAIASLRELHQSGIRFEIGGNRMWRRRQSWITPQTSQGI